MAAATLGDGARAVLPLALCVITERRRADRGKDHVPSRHVFVYPAKGQSEEQQTRDQQECHDWAVKQTGVDPVKLAEQTPAQQAARGGGLAKGMAGGAALGAARGAVQGEPGELAGRGAGVGGIIAMVRARRAMQQEHETYTKAHQDQETQLARYDRAYTACLTGRGYTVQ